ncbi:MAG: hypothetical protein M3Y09_02925 [Actinomycetota bacterium]|nr:hypothetical protein [Actinomycetota bacterium]
MLAAVAGAAAGVDVSAVEGQSFTGNVVSGLSCPLANATIIWGDGISTPGASDGSTGIQGTHTYTEDGTYSGSVSYTYMPTLRTCPTGPQTASFQATVQDAPLTGAGINVSGTAGQSLTAVVAHIADTNPNASASDFSAQITWGDGTSSAGIVSNTTSGGFDVTGTHTYATGGNYPITTNITDTGGSRTTATAKATVTAATTATTTTTAPPPIGVPVNVRRPFVSFSPSSNSFVCEPGTWRNLSPGQAFTYEWLRQISAGGVSVVARTRTYQPVGRTAHGLFGCRVTVPSFTGSTIATPVFTPLTPTTVPLNAYGNFRIRGIDVFQVVQPNSCAAMFSFPAGPFPCLSGGGTPTNYYLPAGTLTAGADPQRTSYLGVNIDADKQTTAVVYVDRTEGVDNPGQHLEVTLKALSHGRQIGTALTRGLTKPLRFSSTPWVAPSERNDPAYGVQFQIPAKWLQVAARGRGATIDLVATIGFPAGTPKLIAVECNPRQLTVKNLNILVNRDCSPDNSFRLDHLPALHLLPLQIRSFELLGNGQNPVGSITAPDKVLSKARQLYPGGERMSVWPYANWIGVRDQETLTATAAPVALKGETAPVFTCNGLRYGSTAATATTPIVPQTVSTATRSCREGAIAAVVAQWETENPDSGFDATVAVHDYKYPGSAGGSLTEGGWTDLAHGTLATAQSRSEALHPLFLVNDGSANRPIGAAAHELGHVLGLPHASAACGGGTGGQIGESWAPDQTGRLQGIDFDQSTATPVTPVLDYAVAPLFDLMSYCGTEANLWLSPRNWNHTFATLRSYAGLPGAPATDHPSLARAAATGVGGQAFVVGVAGAEGARIVRVVQPHGHDAIPAAAPSSSLRLRALDSAGRVLVEEGVQVQQLTDAPGAATFEAPVPVGAAAVELTSHAVVLDRKQRNGAPRVRLLAPTRRARARAHGSLAVRWSATDPEGDQLQATVDYSFDGGRSWRTVFNGPSTGEASVPGRFLEGSRRARIRVYVNDGFNEANVISPVFRADGTSPVAQIVRPGPGEPVRGDERTVLIGSAFDDHHRLLRGRALTWYAGRHRLGSGERLEATLPAGRVLLRLVVRDQTGRQTTLQRVLHVVPARVRLLQLSAPDVIRHRSRTITVRVAASTAATLTRGGQHYHIGRLLRTIVVRLPARPASGLLTLPIQLVAGGPGVTGSTRGAIVVVRL